MLRASDSFALVQHESDGYGIYDLISWDIFWVSACFWCSRCIVTGLGVAPVLLAGKLSVRHGFEHTVFESLIV
jgi:hypothetical protein